jgi:hypothetical protein
LFDTPPENWVMLQANDDLHRARRLPMPRRGGRPVRVCSADEEVRVD